MKNIILLDFDFDIELNGAYRIDLDVVFNPISVKRGKITLVDYYIGSTGAEITLDVSKGLLLNYTEATTLDNNYENTKKGQRHTTLNLSPPLGTGQVPDEEIDTQVDTIIRAATDEKNTLNAKFTSAERSLTPILMGNVIKWMITLPRNETVIHDFLIGNLYLFATCTWENSTKSGYVYVRPSDIRFFDSERKPIGTTGSLLMRYILWQNGIDIENCNGFFIKFEES